MLMKESQSKTSTRGRKAKGFFVVGNDRGLHTRPSTELVKCAASFKSEISLKHQDLEVNAKSLLGILMLAATKGTKIGVFAVGEDASDAVDTILNLARNNFNLHY